MKIGQKLSQMRPAYFFLLIKTLPTFWAERMFTLIMLIWEFWNSRFPDAAAGAAAAGGRTLRSQLDPSPKHPGMKYFREETLAVDFWGTGNLGTWKSGNLESQKSQKYKFSKSISVLPKMSARSERLWVSRKKNTLILFQAISG